MATLPELFEEDIVALNGAMQDLLIKSEALNVLLIDKGGFLITTQGDSRDCDTTTLAALSAASYAATESIASLVHESNFSSVYQQGESFSLLVENVDQFSLLTVVFKAQISVGAVKYFVRDTIKLIAKQLKLAQNRNPQGGLDLSMLNMADTKGLFTKKIG